MKEKILITVKTYPTISRSYNELVCTAGVRADGTWIRIYPVPFRKLYSRYKKYQWVEFDLIPNKSDKRPESHKLMGPDSIELLDSINTDQNWFERKKYILDKGHVYNDLEHLIELNKTGELSLATFKPEKIVDFQVDEVDRDWDPRKIEHLKLQAKQSDMFDGPEEFSPPVDKLPYKFSYKLEDVKGKSSTMMVEDWEIGMLYWNCLDMCGGNEDEAIALVRKKYFDDFALKKDIHLFLGTTLQYDGWAQNPFVIIGTFTPSFEAQAQLF